MSTSFDAVLSNFTPVQVAKPIPQRVSVELSAFGFAKAHCLTHGITDNDGFQAYHNEAKEKFERYAVSWKQIKRRQLVFFPQPSDLRVVGNDIEIADPEFPYLKLYDIKTDPKGADLKTRMMSFGKVVDRALEEMYANTASAPDDIVHVTCSGYLAPNPLEAMVARRGWFGTTVTNSYHMGCYGAFPGMRIAHGVLASAQLGVTPPKGRVDIVHTELLSAHNNITELKPENIITMTLFADGLIKYSLYSQQALREEGRRGLKILALNECVLPKSLDDMTWVPGSHQFIMTLSPLVPIIIKTHVKAFVISLLARAGIDFETAKDRLVFAVHPGGPKIVDHVQDELGLRPDQVAMSKEVFLENGNMSSATVPHILKGILEEVPLGTQVVALGFGPGLTATGMVLEKV